MTTIRRLNKELNSTDPKLKLKLKFQQETKTTF